MTERKHCLSSMLLPVRASSRLSSTWGKGWAGEKSSLPILQFFLSSLFIILLDSDGPKHHPLHGCRSSFWFLKFTPGKNWINDGTSTWPQEWPLKPVFRCLPQWIPALTHKHTLLERGHGPLCSCYNGLISVPKTTKQQWRKWQSACHNILSGISISEPTLKHQNNTTLLTNNVIWTVGKQEWVQILLAGCKMATVSVSGPLGKSDIDAFGCLNLLTG